MYSGIAELNDTQIHSLYWHMPHLCLFELINDIIVKCHLSQYLSVQSTSTSAAIFICDIIVDKGHSLKVIP